MNRKVFVLEPCKFDISDGERYGDITFIFNEGENKPSVWSNAFIEECISRMRTSAFNPDRDFLMISGPQVPLILLVGNLVASFDTVNLLLFDAATNEYTHKAVI